VCGSNAHLERLVWYSMKLFTRFKLALIILTEHDFMNEEYIYSILLD
jgi:hypothetical protein